MSYDTLRDTPVSIAWHITDGVPHIDAAICEMTEDEIGLEPEEVEWVEDDLHRYIEWKYGHERPR